MGQPSQLDGSTEPPGGSAVDARATGGDVPSSPDRSSERILRDQAISGDLRPSRTRSPEHTFREPVSLNYIEAQLAVGSLQRQRRRHTPRRLPGGPESSQDMATTTNTDLVGSVFFAAMFLSKDLYGRGERIRTSGLSVPNAAR